MVFVAPKLTADQGTEILCQVWAAARGRRKRFLANMSTLIANHCFRLLDHEPRINFSNSFNLALHDSTARVRYNFTIAQLHRVSIQLQLPQDNLRTPEGDVVSSVEALAMVCRRLTEPSKLFTVADGFGRSTTAYNRKLKTTIAIMYANHATLLYFARATVLKPQDDYSAAVARKGSPLRACWAFIDGTKQYIARPSARANPESSFENLQRSVYSGHPRRHCLNWQAVTAPDGLIISVYGPVEGRRHDTTMLIMSGLLEYMHKEGWFEGNVIYGDPAYGTADYLCYPFPLATPGSVQAEFNARMSNVREAVEWGFGRVKPL
ncbi:hypothetical protein PR002_g27893 [Phytophthora rubi]|uniref:DDE Tnp4 domain-containing protein n=1 Tax=Phytophthora rubi TaxID=129364 RepID=A0A6A3HHG3_9STRA|nr:hypothetical protein PR002_g27893 [Phytophthora rubi]